MTKIITRLLVFAIGLPGVLALVFFFPLMNHLAANATAVLVSAIGAMEFSAMVSKRGFRLPTVEAAILGSLLPLAATLRVSFSVAGELELYVLTAAALWIVSSRVFSRSNELASVSERILTAFSTLLYPGVLLIWIVRLNSFPHSTSLLLLMLLMVFGNDSVAWASGMLFGKGNRGIMPASPNKSLAGFIGGISVSILCGVGAAFYLPEVFPSALGGPVAGAVLGLLTGFSTIIGDLAESTLKRSADVKDSGSIVPGRGGLLDSIDSLVFAAPVYFAAYALLFST